MSLAVAVATIATAMEETKTEGLLRSEADVSLFNQ